MTNAALRGKPDAGNPHVRFDGGEVAPAATPRRGSLLYKHARIFAVAIVALALATSAGARTLTWDGTTAGSYAAGASLNSADHWLENDEQATTGPQPGDRLEITGSGNFYFAKESFDLGSAGLTIYHNRKIYVGTAFTGTGVLTFESTDVERVFEGTAASTHSGGTVFKHGWTKFANGYNPLGTGSVTVYQASATRPRFEAAYATRTLANDFILVGNDKYKNWTVFNGQIGCVVSSITSDHDFTIQHTNRGMTVNDSISAPGKTVTFSVANSANAYTDNTKVNGAIDANVVVTAYSAASSWSIVTFSGVSTVATNSLTVTSGTNVLASAASWAGTNITVEAGATLSLKGSGNLSPSAHLAVAEGGTIEVAKDVTVQVAALTIGDKAFPVGRYTAATLPGTVSGDGSIFVLGESSTGLYVWTGGAGNGLWSDTGNWEGGAVPGDGAVVYFPSTATIANETDVTIGANGLSLVLGGDVTLNHGFAGSGALRISGGEFYLRANVVFSHTGGTTLSGNIRFDMGTPKSTNNAFGTGVLTIDGMSGGSPFIRFVNYAQTITNDIVILGAATNRTYTHQSRTVRGLVVDFNAGYISGSVTGDDDVMFGTGYGSLHVRGNVTVPKGKTIRLQNAYVSEETPRYLEVTKTLTGNLSVEGVGLVRLTTSATCTGDVTVRNTATLEVTAAGNLAETAVLSIPDGGKIDIASGVKVIVAELWVGGAKQANGVYRASDLPAVISGSGSLRVGPKSGIVVWVE